VNVKDAEGKTPFDYAEGEVKKLLNMVVQGASPGVSGQPS
jgi:hypothetical protein